MADELPDELIIDLRKPVEFGSDTFTQLVLREPTVGEVAQAQKAAKDGGLASDIVLVALVSGVPKPAVERMGYRDIKQAVEYLAGFINGGPETGE